jgi:hypothetical protein
MTMQPDGTVQVMLLGHDKPEMSGQAVTARRTGQGWTLVRLSSWFH